MKPFLLFPLSALAIGVISGCSSNKAAPVESADGTLSPGIMQPVGSAESNANWEPTLQPQSMPESMSSGVQNVTPIQTPAEPKLVDTVSTTAQNAKTKVSQQVSQDFTIPRDATTNAPLYNQIDKGFYKGNTYTVRKGDTMFLIAYISGMDVKELADKNNLSEPYNLKIGQVLKLGDANTVAQVASTVTTTKVQSQQPQPKPVKPEVTYTAGPNNTRYGSDGSITGPVKASTGTPTTISNTQATDRVKVDSRSSVTPPPPATSSISWTWPTNGRVIQGFSSSDGGNKGLDIAGSRGQAVNAAAAGRVVYAGNALRGYGNLIIIKHNDDYLSAYAHNESILVKDQQQVSVGQKIATMGSSGTNGVKLHFEIRYKGKSVDPVRYLPSR